MVKNTHTGSNVYLTKYIHPLIWIHPSSAFTSQGHEELEPTQPYTQHVASLLQGQHVDKQPFTLTVTPMANVFVHPH